MLFLNKKTSHIDALEIRNEFKNESKISHLEQIFPQFNHIYGFQHNHFGFSVQTADFDSI